MSSNGYTPNMTGPQPSNLITAGTAVLSENTTTTPSAANPARKSITIQNQSANVLYIALGEAASATVFHFSLKACTAAKDGTGGVVKIEDYTGLVSAHGTGKSYTVAEFV
tara:strand:- start:1638 stop:1967 length:330 start_codon:yes stop_codon:yes gene_type:complete